MRINDVQRKKIPTAKMPFFGGKSCKIWRKLVKKRIFGLKCLYRNSCTEVMSFLVIVKLQALNSTLLAQKKKILENTQRQNPFSFFFFFFFFFFCGRRALNLEIWRKRAKKRGSGRCLSKTRLTKKEFFVLFCIYQNSLKDFIYIYIIEVQKKSANIFQSKKQFWGTKSRKL